MLENLGGDSLVTKVLQDKYFPSGDLLNASTPSFYSFLWRSIMLGKELCKAGLKWRIGDGKFVHIYGDRGLPYSPLK